MNLATTPAPAPVPPSRVRAPKSLLDQIGDDLDEATRYNDSAEVRLRPRERDNHGAAEHAQ
jgi:hypothetical protein